MLNAARSSTRTNVALRTSALTRSLHGTPPMTKSATDKVYEVADKVNRKVGKGLASAIDAGENAAQTMKSTAQGGEDFTRQKTAEAQEKTNQATAKVKEDVEKLRK